MDLEMVLNELSFRTPVANIPVARQLMTELINTLTQATRSGLPRILRTHNDINSIELAPDYPIARWRNDSEVRLEERSFFRTLTSKAPIWGDAPQDIKNDFDLSLVSFKGEEAVGLSFALVSDALVISLLSDSQWDNSRLNVEVTQTDDNEEFIGRFSLETYSLEESGESEATLNRYSQERTFRCPDGKERLFERHVKLRFCNWRIHFFPLQYGKVIVGYVGRHLPTDKYPT